MPSYQIVVVVKTGSDKEREKTLDFVKGLLGKAKVKEEDLGSKALAYAIKGELSGHYYNLTVDGDLNADFEKKMHENADILRHLVLKK